MTAKKLSKTTHLIFFIIFLGGCIFIQTSLNEHKTILLVATALCFTGAHFFLFAKNFATEMLFLIAGFTSGFLIESILSNSGVYHYGLIDIPGLSWPPPWIAAMWLMIPILIIHTDVFLEKHPIISSALISILSLGLYYFIGKKLDLVFFNPPILQGFVAFLSFWFLMLRLLIRIKTKLSI